MSAAAGIVVTETKTPMSVFARASVSDTTPTTPASTATTTENTLGASISVGYGSDPVGVRGGLQVERANDEAEDQGGDDRGPEPDDQRADAGHDPPAVSLVHAERDVDDRPVLRTDHHGPDDQYLRVRQNADGRRSAPRSP